MLRLFDTYTRQLRDFEPLEPVEVRMYCCGPTVYNYAHADELRSQTREAGYDIEDTSKGSRMRPLAS
jgi:cysteinyl-tRNA synthetase